ncbi:MAG TPA: SPOR domain-containing protein [Gemmatimonadales bacterium]|nr:SPOR domain-containing protein [Gemmatimonadales bacterium]
MKYSPAICSATFLLAALAPAMASAQLPLMPVTPRFQQIVRLAQDGYGDSARSMIGRFLTATPSTDPSYPEALFTSATVANSGDEMRKEYLRVTLDYGQSAWADKALLRLAQLDYGTGNNDGVIQRVTQIFNDYPTSPVLPNAALWGARAAFGRQQVQLGCTWLAKGLAKAGDDLELKNQLNFSNQRCMVGPGLHVAPPTAESLRVKPPVKDTMRHDSVAHAVDTTHSVTPPPPPLTTRADTSRRAPPPVTRTPPAKAPSTKAAPPATAPKSADHWRVQLIAINDTAVIRRVVARVTAAGYKAYKVAGPRGLTRVQAGPFATRAEATAALAKLKAAVGGSPYITPSP